MHTFFYCSCQAILWNVSVLFFLELQCKRLQLLRHQYEISPAISSGHGTDWLVMENSHGGIVVDEHGTQNYLCNIRYLDLRNNSIRDIADGFWDRLHNASCQTELAQFGSQRFGQNSKKHSRGQQPPEALAWRESSPLQL